jgi:hypothetical protein
MRPAQAGDPAQPVEILSREDLLDVSDVVRGWTVRVSEIFDVESPA